MIPDLNNRVKILARILEREYPESADPIMALGQVVDVTNPTNIWLAIAVCAGRLPTPDQVLETVRVCEFSSQALLAEIERFATPTSLARTISVVRDKVLVDVANTAAVPINTGIQRAVRTLAESWMDNSDVVLVSWFDDTQKHQYDALRLLTNEEIINLPKGGVSVDLFGASRCELVVPWNCRYFVPELAAEPSRAARIQAMATYSPNAVISIGHDTVPITAGETTIPEMPSNYASLLSALRHCDLIITTCEGGSTVEFRGWSKTLNAIGATGPQIEAVLWAIDAPSVNESYLKEAERLLVTTGIPMILVVGSHEPRKNHMAVLFAAEMLWRQGLEFSLVFIGGNSWGSDSFRAEVERLREKYPISVIQTATDDLLGAAYRLARFTVFPSLSEGFGVPISESLSVGTPVITSNYGAMAEIAAAGGALLVDPRSDASIIDAMRELLVDESVLQRLRVEAKVRPLRTVAKIANEIWAKIVAVPIETDHQFPASSN